MIENEKDHIKDDDEKEDDNEKDEARWEGWGIAIMIRMKERDWGVMKSQRRIMRDDEEWTEVRIRIEEKTDPHE